MLDTKYNHKNIEKIILDDEKVQSACKVTYNKKNSFSIVMPPPNVTGHLHLGHALVTTLQDTLVRYHRMKDQNVLWQIGVDHAGIATQVIVEKNLAAKNIKRTDLTREDFIKEVYQWKNYSEERILNQLKRLGISCSWDYVAFTMDDHFIKAVNKIFVKLYNDGLIYKDNRLVNWDTKLQTAISDLEVVSKEEKGKFYYLKYPLKKGGFLEVATTRPETIFGDSALAVNPNDDRYKHLIGEKAIVPFLNREIDIIADNYTNMEKGTGVVKITPAHDFNDFEVGKRHNLEVINILNKDGTLNEVAPKEFIGLKIKAAREEVVKKLEENNLILKIDDHTNSVPYGDRSNTVIEPFLTTQWFVKSEVLAKGAIEVIKNDTIEIIPAMWKNLYFEWMENIKPWCISRQLWWGHRIPAWYSEDNKMYIAETAKEAQELAKKDNNGKEVNLTQETDVLDTWFSSSLWPFVSLGWIDEDEASKNLKNYYPTSVLITAHDILFFWVARMIMMGLYITKEVPFKKVYLNPLILDEKGQKMSKSKGNNVDPLDLIEEYGTDSLRYSLVSYSAQGHSIKFSNKSLENSRNFITKIWNIYRFLEHYKLDLSTNTLDIEVKNPINKWILHNLNHYQNLVFEGFDSYRFHDVSSNIYKFIWNYYCDWYLELIKPILNGSNEEDKLETAKVATFAFTNILKIIHPIMPYISEYLWQEIYKNNEVLAVQSFSDLSKFNFEEDSKNIEYVINFITHLRRIRNELNVPFSLSLNLYVKGSIPKIINTNINIITVLAKLNSISVIDGASSSSLLEEVIDKELTIYIDLKEFVDKDKEIARLTKDIAKIELEASNLNNMLNRGDFKSKAPKELIESYEANLESLEKKLNSIKNVFNKIQNI